MCCGSKCLASASAGADAWVCMRIENMHKVHSNEDLLWVKVLGQGLCRGSRRGSHAVSMWHDGQLAAVKSDVPRVKVLGKGLCRGKMWEDSCQERSGEQLRQSKLGRHVVQSKQHTPLLSHQAGWRARETSCAHCRQLPCSPIQTMKAAGFHHTPSSQPGGLDGGRKTGRPGMGCNHSSCGQRNKPLLRNSNHTTHRAGWRARGRPACRGCAGPQTATRRATGC